MPLRSQLKRTLAHTVRQVPLVGHPLVRAGKIIDRAHFVRRIKPEQLPGEFLICSPGGVGTTFLMRFFNNYVQTNDPFDKDGLKHLPAPPQNIAPSARAAFILSDPVSAVLSIYAREFAEQHSIKLGSRSLVIPQSLEEYAQEGRDHLGLETQFNLWRNPSRRSYPVLFIRYESIWEQLEQLYHFFGVAENELQLFPRQKTRRSRREQYSQETITKLETIYRPLTISMEQVGHLELF